MKLPSDNKDKSFKDYLSESLDESIDESFANYGGTNVIGGVGSSSKNKYTPATVLKAPPVRHRNPDITMGEPDAKTQAPSQFLYPFESLFTELADIYVRIDAVQGQMDLAKDLPTLGPAKTKAEKTVLKTWLDSNRHYIRLLRN